MIKLLSKCTSTSVALRRVFSSLPLPVYQRSQQFVESYNPDTFLVSMIDSPKLIRKPDRLLVERWHIETPFDIKAELLIPIISFKTGAYTGQCIRLD